MKLIEKENLKYFTFDIFENTKTVKHAFTTKQGGVSTGCFKSLNFGFKNGDKYENVLENYKILCNALNMEYKNIVYARQTHNTIIKNITKKDCGKGILYETDFIGVDGLVTNEKNVVLVTFHADCVPIFLLDPVKKVISLIHAGWRGTVDEIASKAVDKMVKDYMCMPLDILCGIGPSIGVCCFQVGEEVKEEYIQKMPYSERFIFDDTEENKYKLDLWQINREILIKRGIKPDNIEVTDTCTKCNHELFYSHRNTGTKRGTMISIMSLI